MRLLGRGIARCKGHGKRFFDTPPKELEGRNYITAEEAAQQIGVFDAVSAMHIIQHDDDTDALLAKILAHVKAGATVIIEVPNVERFS